ncbi:hypothetical protein SLA2020_077840 [Shorea laevis]
MLVGNKCDLENKRAVSKEDDEQFAEAKWSLIRGGVCCNNSNVEEAFMRTAAIVLKNPHAGIIDAQNLLFSHLTKYGHYLFKMIAVI